MPKRVPAVDSGGCLPQSGGVALKLHIRSDGEIAVAYCKGALTIVDEMDFRSQLRSLLPDHPQLVLEMGELEEISSGGLGALAAIFVSFRSFGGDIRLANLSPSVAEALGVCGMSKLFRIFDTESQAVKSYRPSAGQARR